MLRGIRVADDSAMTIAAGDCTRSARPPPPRAIGSLALPLTATLAAKTATTVYAIGLVGNGSVDFKALVTPIG